MEEKLIGGYNVNATLVIMTNRQHIKSIKGIIRHLRKQYLPRSMIFILHGNYIGEHYIIKVS
jgi:hypothetical protein